MQHGQLAVGQAPRPLWRIAVVFLLLVVAQQWAWTKARGTVIEKAVIEVATVGTAVAIINAWTPAVRASAAGARIQSPGGGINILNGCEGTEVLFLLVAALLAYPMSWRWRGIGIFTGAALVFVLNQLRVLALFYSFRTDRALFEELHGLIAPMILIVLVTGYLIMLIRWDQGMAAAPVPQAPGSVS